MADEPTSRRLHRSPVCGRLLAIEMKPSLPRPAAVEAFCVNV
jgi:hypothetical protein